MLNKKIILSTLIIITALSIVAGGTYALFTDTEISSSNVLAAGEVDLGVDNHSYYNGILNPETTWRVDYDLSDNPPRQFFKFLDLKPGDWGEDTISLHVRNNDAWVCADVTLTSNDDNGINEPEGLDGDSTPGIGEGELANLINFYWWADDGDNVYETTETLLPAGALGNLDIGETATVALADSQNNIWGDTGPIPGDEVRYLAKAWCFGNATMTPYAQDGGNLGSGPDERPIICDGSQLTNITQTDSLKADLSFRAIQSRNNTGFECNVAEPTITPTPTTPVLISCESNDVQFASSSFDNDQGLRKDGSAVLANRSISSAAYGAPQTSGASTDAVFPVGSFFSLGFPLSGNTASIVYGFSQPFFPNPSGPDLQVFEVTGGSYPDEVLKVEAGPTSTGPWTVLAASAIRDEDIELGILPSAQFVRLTDVSNMADIGFPSDADGYDLDAVKTFCKAVVL